MPNLTRQERQDAYDTSVENVSKFSGRISELCKFVWAGALAIFYALVTSESGGTTKFVGAQKQILFLAAVAGSLALLFDYLQNISAYIQATKMADWIKDRDTIAVATYNRRTKDFWSKANAIFFVLKNLAVLVAAALVAYVIIVSFLR